ncbi:MAG: hypothetical protein HZB77_08715 [Chloroflexi bacterium]|nr:hypothetical protein [Chloroflexota bacterium]
MAKRARSDLRFVHLVAEGAGDLEFFDVVHPFLMSSTFRRGTGVSVGVGAAVSVAVGRAATTGGGADFCAPC